MTSKQKQSNVDQIFRIQAEGLAVQCFDSTAVGALEEENHQSHPWWLEEAYAAKPISSLPAEDPVIHWKHPWQT